MKRDICHIDSDILEYCIKPRRITHIIYKVNLNYKVGLERLDFFQLHGLINVQFKGKTKYYMLTPKGLERLKLAKQFYALYNEASLLTKPIFKQISMPFYP